MKLSHHCYCLTGLAAESPWAVNAGFIVGEQTTLIVDTGSNTLSGQTIHGYAQSVSPDNSIIVVNSEPHFDHIGGNSYFTEHEIPILAHPELKRTQTNFTNNKTDFNATILNSVRKNNHEEEAFFIQTTLANPTGCLDHDEHLDLGSVDVIVYYTPGHTPLNISLFVPKDKVMYCSDTVVTAYLPNLECGDVSLWNQWLTSLEIIRSLSPEIIVTGHGPCLIGKEQIAKHLAYLQDIINTAITNGKAPTA